MNTKITAKVHKVRIGDKAYFVEAQTKAGAIRDVVSVLVEELRKDAACDLATGEDLYRAGVDGLEIIGGGRFKNAVDPSQIGLAGIPETGGELA